MKIERFFTSSSLPRTPFSVFQKELVSVKRFLMASVAALFLLGLFFSCASANTLVSATPDGTDWLGDFILRLVAFVAGSLTAILAVLVLCAFIAGSWEHRGEETRVRRVIYVIFLVIVGTWLWCDERIHHKK